jgi:hypothetical protein
MRPHVVRHWRQIALLPFLPLPLIAGELGRETLKLPTGEAFTVEHPSGWKSESSVSDAASPGDATLRLSNRDGTAVLLISVLPGQRGATIDNMDELEQLLATGTRGLLKDSVQKSILPLSFKSPHAYGVYATLTDARYASSDQPPPKGVYRHSATFVLNCESQAVTATFLTNEAITEAADLAIMILKTLKKDGGPAAAAVTGRPPAGPSTAAGEASVLRGQTAGLVLPPGSKP